MDLDEVASRASDPPAVPASTTSASPGTTSSTSPATTSSTTTIPVPEVLAYDAGGVPVNGQTTGVVRTPSGWVVPAIEQLDEGFRVWTPCGREQRISGGEYIREVDFVIDPGHGGSEPGAVGPAGTREADVNLAVGRLVAEALEADGHTVVMTRDADVRVPIVTRAEIGLALDPIAMISIHHNAGTEAVSGVPGTEMFFQLGSADSRRLAGLLYEETRRVLDPLGGVWFSMPDAGAMGRVNDAGTDYYGMLRRPAAITSVLAEFAYINNPIEEALLLRADVRAQLAEAVRAAVARYLKSDDPGSGYTDDPLFRGFGPSGAGRTTDCTDPTLES